MKKNIFVFFIMMFPVLLNAQTVKFSFALKDSCVYVREKMHDFEINIQNNTSKDIWVDLGAINFKVYMENDFLFPFSDTTIGFYVINDKTFKDGFVLVKKNSFILFTKKTTLFENYYLDKNKKYSVKAYYKNARNKFLKKVYRIDSYIGEGIFLLCD